MRIITIMETDTTYIDPEIKDLTDEPVLITKLDGYGGCDIAVGNHYLTWAQFDTFMEALTAAAKEWRK